MPHTARIKSLIAKDKDRQKITHLTFLNSINIDHIEDSLIKLHQLHL